MPPHLPGPFALLYCTGRTCRVCLALTAQVVLAALISLAAGPVRLQWLWIAFLVSITTGKAVWVSACPQ